MLADRRVANNTTVNRARNRYHNKAEPLLNSLKLDFIINLRWGKRECGVVHIPPDRPCPTKLNYKFVLRPSPYRNNYRTWIQAQTMTKIISSFSIIFWYYFKTEREKWLKTHSSGQNQSVGLGNAGSFRKRWESPPRKNSWRHSRPIDRIGYQSNKPHVTAD